MTGTSACVYTEKKMTSENNEFHIKHMHMHVFAAQCVVLDWYIHKQMHSSIYDNVCQLEYIV